MSQRGLDPREPAVSDAELIRYLDGELNDTERASLERRLHGDAPSKARLATLRIRGQRLRTILLRTDPAHAIRPIVRHSARPWLRAAAILLAVAATALLVPPVRAWVIDGLQRIAGREASEPATAPPPATKPAGETLLLHFTVEGDRFVIDVQQPQSAGEVIVRTGEDGTASAGILGNPDDAELLITPGTLRIQNRQNATASYRITLPPSVATVMIRRAAGSDIVATPAPGRELRIPLTGSVGATGGRPRRQALVHPGRGCPRTHPTRPPDPLTCTYACACAYTTVVKSVVS